MQRGSFWRRHPKYYREQVSAPDIVSKMTNYATANAEPGHYSFTFDSCYSYLSHPPLPSTNGHTDDDESEPALPDSLIVPLVDRAVADYACADLLLRLPGAIPIPAFDTDVPMPSGEWVSADYSSFTPEILSILSRPTSDIPASTSTGSTAGRRRVPRRVIDVPLIVRKPSPDVHTPEFRAKLLASMNVPSELHDHKIVLVSFGGQSIPRPRSRPPTPLASPIERPSERMSSTLDAGIQRSAESGVANAGLNGTNGGGHAYGPGRSLDPAQGQGVGLLPPGWIAIVCGLSGGNNEALRNDLPDGFFASDRDVYVPDLTMTADVVLGKLVSSKAGGLIMSRCSLLMFVISIAGSSARHRDTELAQRRFRVRLHSFTVSDETSKTHGPPQKSPKLLL